LADRLVVRDPRVLVADRNREELEKSLGRFGSDVGNDRWNLKRFGLCEGPMCALTLAPVEIADWITFAPYFAVES